MSVPIIIPHDRKACDASFAEAHVRNLAASARAAARFARAGRRWRERGRRDAPRQVDSEGDSR